MAALAASNVIEYLINNGYISSNYIIDDEEKANISSLYFLSGIFSDEEDLKNTMELLGKIAVPKITSRADFQALTLSDTKIKEIKETLCEINELLLLPSLKYACNDIKDIFDRIVICERYQFPYMDQTSRIFPEVASIIPDDESYAKLIDFRIDYKKTYFSDLKSEYFKLDKEYVEGDNYTRYDLLLSLIAQMEELSFDLFKKTFRLNHQFEIAVINKVETLDGEALLSDNTELFEYLMEENPFIDIDRIKMQVDGYQSELDDNQRNGRR